MSDTISLSLRGISGTIDVTAPEGSTVADVLEQEGVSPSLHTIRGGVPVSGDTPVEDGDTVTTTPGAVKQGF